MQCPGNPRQHCFSIDKGGSQTRKVNPGTRVIQQERDTHNHRAPFPLRRQTDSMATALTKTALVRQMAEKLELTSKQTVAFFDLLADTAVKETKKNGVFVIPGLGRLVKAERKARTGRNPQTGEAIKIKAKTVVKFRIAKAAKDAIAPPKKTAEK